LRRRTSSPHCEVAGIRRRNTEQHEKCNRLERKFYREDGSLKSIPELDDDTAAALAGMEVEEAYDYFGKGQAKGLIKKIKFADKGLNLERLGRYLKLFTDRVEHNGTVHLAEIIAKARKRVAEQCGS
jgi:hypothetical protein